MQWLSEQRAPWAVVFCGLVLFLLLLGSCATPPSYRKYVGPLFDPKTPSRAEESFPDLWEKWTVDLGMATRGGKPWQLGSPFAMGGDRGGPGGEFPMQITATLMDTMLIEAGLQHYDTILAMTPEERAEFRRAYFRRYDVENHLLIWCELQTSWTELYLDLDRWIIYIEDDAVNQYEPVQILEEPQPIRPTVMDKLPEFLPEQRRRRWEIHQKILMLCFPKRDFYGNPVLSEKVQFLKLVFQLTDDEKTRSEGMWVFKE
jgi:hypothetical protein